MKSQIIVGIAILMSLLPAQAFLYSPNDNWTAWTYDNKINNWTELKQVNLPENQKLNLTSVVEFLKKDPTNNYEYIDQNYACFNFANEVTINAQKAKLPAYLAVADLSEKANLGKNVRHGYTVFMSKDNMNLVSSNQIDLNDILVVETQRDVPFENNFFYNTVTEITIYKNYTLGILKGTGEINIVSPPILQDEIVITRNKSYPNKITTKMWYDYNTTEWIHNPYSQLRSQIPLPEGRSLYKNIPSKNSKEYKNWTEKNNNFPAVPTKKEIIPATKSWWEQFLSLF